MVPPFNEAASGAGSLGAKARDAFGVGKHLSKSVPYVPEPSEVTANVFLGSPLAILAWLGLGKKPGRQQGGFGGGGTF